MSDEEGRRPAVRTIVKRASPHGVGNMEPGVRHTVTVKSIGRNSSRVYCDACGSKKVNGKCPRGHPA